MIKEKSPTEVRLNPDYRLTFWSLCGYHCIVGYRSILPLIQSPVSTVRVRLFRASKKTSISGEPASPIADSSPSCERIKTDYNSYLYTWCSLIVINNLQEIARLARGMRLSKINQKRLTSE